MNDYGFMDIFGPGAQARNLYQMGNEIEDAHSDENRSRVLQSREERQRQHEIYLENLRHEQLLARLQAQQQANAQQRANDAFNDRQAAGQAAYSQGGGYTRTLNNQGRWEYS